MSPLWARITAVTKQREMIKDRMEPIRCVQSLFFQRAMCTRVLCVLSAVARVSMPLECNGGCGSIANVGWVNCWMLITRLRLTTAHFSLADG